MELFFSSSAFLPLQTAEVMRWNLPRPGTHTRGWRPDTLCNSVTGPQVKAGGDVEHTQTHTHTLWF